MSDAGASDSAGAAAGLAFICGTCGKRYAAEGDCPACPGSALLDLRRPDVQELLKDIDDRARRSRDQRWLWVGVAVAVLIIGFLNLQPFWQLVRRSTITLMALAAAGIQRLLMKLFPARRISPR